MKTLATAFVSLMIGSLIILGILLIMYVLSNFTKSRKAERILFIAATVMFIMLLITAVGTNITGGLALVRLIV